MRKKFTKKNWQGIAMEYFANCKLQIANFILFLFISGTASGQVDLTLYNMKSIPQSVYNNPSMIPASKLNIAIPALSSIYFYVSNSGFSYDDLIKKRADDSLVVDIDNAINKMASTNFMGIAFSVDLFMVGFTVKKNYFCLNVTEKANFNFTYSKEFFQLIQNGNGPFLGKTADLSDIGFDGSHYREYGVSMAREFSKKFTGGARIKYLYGMENISTAESNLGLYTDERTYDLSLTSGVVVNTSTPANNSDGYDNLSTSDYLLSGTNTGLGFDLGGHYTLNDRWNFSASVVDLGYINWKSNVKNYTTASGVYKFEGVDLVDFVHDTTNAGQHVLDSLNNAFTPTETFHSYKTNLSPHAFLGGNYVFNENTFAGILLRGQFFKGILLPSATVSMNHQVGRHLSLALSYSYLNRSYDNIGAGMAVNAGPFQLYATADDLLGVFMPLGTHALNVHFGVNLIFGRPQKDRDHDKVVDKDDLCPDVPGLVALHGCPDIDGDSIADANDACPDVKGLAIFQGCPDLDGDSIPDRLDSCPSVAGLRQFHGCPDTDGDSIPDLQDSCPVVKGIALFHGCPDTDGDSIPDALDSCPKVKGIALLHGCPDKDGDGITDALDSCPDMKGLAIFHGCPDTDGDSIPDKDDACPLVKGVASNHGCPAVEKVGLNLKDVPVKATLTKQEEDVLVKVFKSLEFETGKSVIRSSSYPSLQALADLLKKKPSFKLLVEGHTDNVGSAETNMKLSTNRAKAVKLYLTEQGVDGSRITAKGYGLTKPIASNKTVEGRQMNRRVEFTVVE